MTLVNSTNDIIVDQQHCRLGRMKLTVIADCLSGKRPLMVAWLVNCLVTTRSTILDKKEKLEMGRNELRSSGSIEGFFKTCSHPGLLL